VSDARVLAGLEDPEPYLLAHSGLPGPRANIGLGLAAAALRSAAELRRWAVATAGVVEAGGDERRSEQCKALRKGLGYCWSVAVAAGPEAGRSRRCAPSPSDEKAFPI
jgi:hypothetical protein